MERELKVKVDSVDSSGIKKDYKEAIIEYIWNGFDAGANLIEITYEANILNGVESISISDNGSGIMYENLDNTFAAFLSSEKRVNSSHITNIHGNKGKGRFSFLGFAKSCNWKTIYECDDSRKYTFSIDIDGEKPNKYYSSEKVISTATTGTTVTIYNIYNLTYDQIKSKELEQSILESFAWYLYLKKNENYKIMLNGKEIKYNNFIDENLTEDFEENIDEEKFNIFFIKWRGDVKYKYFFHMLDEANNQKAKQHTKYNNNGIGFVHSVFIKSDYFNGFKSLDCNKNDIDGQVKIVNYSKKNEKDAIYKALIRKLDNIVNNKYKEFIKEDSNNFIKKLEDEKIFPEFANDIYGKLRKKELESAVKEVYCAQPKIFRGARKE